MGVGRPKKVLSSVIKNAAKSLDSYTPVSVLSIEKAVMEEMEGELTTKERQDYYKILVQIQDLRYRQAKEFKDSNPDKITIIFVPPPEKIND